MGVMIMKKTVRIILAVLLGIHLSACGNSTAAADPVSSETVNPSSETETAAVSEEETIDDPSWDQLEDLGKIETENGIFYVSITVPASFAGSDVTQEQLDSEAGENYTSAKLNEDGSITYKMTKKQHKAMLNSLTEGIDSSLQEMIGSDDYAFTEITHNDTFTEFNVHLSTDEVGFAESFMVMAFYMYGGMYGLFSGKEPDKILVNYYGADGSLIETADSSEAGE